MPIPRRIAVNVIAALGLCLAAPAVACAAATLEFDQPALVFPEVGIYDQAPMQSVKVTNSGDEDASVGALYASGPFWVDYNASDCDDYGTIFVGNSCNLVVAFDPQVAGPAGGEATIEYSDGGGPGQATLSLSGTGAKGTLQADPVNFYPQPYFYGGQQQQVNVSNPSPYTVPVGGVTITGPDAGSFSIPWSGCNGNYLQAGQNCSFGVQFEATAPGTFTAQLEIANDGSVDPVVVPLGVEALEGPIASLSPSSVDYGVVKAGSSAQPQLLTVTNVGDFPLQVQQILIISGSPQVFPVSEDECSGQVVLPGEECELTVGFAPTKAGERFASVFLISNTPQPVSVVTLSGEGMLDPSGTAELTNVAKVGVPIVCLTHGYRDVDTIGYRWLRDDAEIAGATSSTYIPVGADVGASISCRVTAENAVGSQVVTSDQSAAVAAADPGPTGPQGPAGQDGARGERGAEGKGGGRGALLFTRFAGSAGHGYALRVVSTSGLSQFRTTLLSRRTRIRAGRAAGYVKIRGNAGLGRFRVRGATSAAVGGTRIELRRRSIEITGLPSGTTSVTVRLRGDSISGRGGRIRTTALVGEQATRESTLGVFARLP